MLSLLSSHEIQGLSLSLAWLLDLFVMVRLFVRAHVRACVRRSMLTTIYTCMHTCVCVRVCVRVCVCVRARMHACIHACMHTYIDTYIRACMHTYIDTYIRTCMHIHIHAYLHTYRLQAHQMTCVTEILLDMARLNIQPDSITFTLVMASCETSARHGNPEVFVCVPFFRGLWVCVCVI